MTRVPPQKKIQRLLAVSNVFTPGSPIKEIDLFSGRMDQIIKLAGAIRQDGQHAAIYGERGVGKTSLANVLADAVNAFQHTATKANIRCARVNCNTEDTFRTLWKGILKKLDIHPEDHEVTVPLVVDELENRSTKTLIIIDEFDRLRDQTAISLMADTIKALSDTPTSSTVILVGVGDSIAELIGDHRSVERAMTQVNMPRMSSGELRQLIQKGVSRLEMTISQAALSRLAWFSEGLPFYAHLLSLHATSSAVQDDRNEVSDGDVQHAVNQAVDKSQHSIIGDYAAAIRSQRKDNKFAAVLLACALCEKDDLGYFPPRAVQYPLEFILNNTVQMSAYSRHLNEFCTDEHHNVLQKAGVDRKPIYRFDNPIIQPYVILRALAEKRLTEDALASFKPRPDPTLFDRLPPL